MNHERIQKKVSDHHYLVGDTFWTDKFTYDNWPMVRFLLYPNRSIHMVSAFIMLRLEEDLENAYTSEE
jgi:hypothetical protein